MPEEKQIPGWRKRFLANRMTLESILFENLYAGLACAAAIAIFSSLLLTQWVLRQGSFFNAGDASGFQMVFACLDHFRSGGVWNLFKPLSTIAPIIPPLYYLTYVPVLKFITGDLSWAMILVNSFYLCALALAIFIAVKKNRNNKSGWLAAGFAMAMPFVIEASRHPDHRLASMALAAAVYATYINSEDFEYPSWNVWFGVFFGLGFFADTMFWVYILPLVPFLISGLTNQLAGVSIAKGLLPGAILAVPWYCFASAAWALRYFSGAAAPQAFRPGLWLYLVDISGYAGLPLFLLGGAALLWMYFSVFMPYSSRKIVAAWFWVPFVLVYFMFGARPEHLYPALLPLAVAVAVMTPGKVRKYAAGVVLLFLLLNQSGVVGPLSLGRSRLAGTSRPSRAEFRAAELVAELKSRTAGAKAATVALAGEDENFNHLSFNYLAGKAGAAALKFAVYQPGTLGLADFVVYKTAGFNTPRSDGSAALAREISRPWFTAVFSQAAAFDLPDASRLVLYAKKPVSDPPFRDGKHRFKKMDLGGILMDEGDITLSGFDPARGVYAKAALFSPYATFEGFDIYGLNLEISDFSGSSDTGAISDIRLTKAGTIRIVSVRLTSYAFERYLAGRYAGLKSPEVKLDGIVQIDGLHDGNQVHAELFLSARPPALDLSLINFTYDGYQIPGFMRAFFKFKYDMSGLPCEIRFNRIKLENQMLAIS
jgi:hypothetical protein